MNQRSNESVAALPASRSRGAIDRAMAAILALAMLAGVAALVDFVRYNPGAHVVGGDAGVYWDTAGAIADGQWQADQPFHSAPLYFYILGCVRWLGGGLMAAYVLQLLVHWLTALVLFSVAARKFDRATALVVLAMFLLLAEPAFLSTRLLAGTWQLLFVATTLWAADRFTRRRRWIDAVMLGTSIGLTVLVFAPAMALVPIAAIGICLGRRPSSGEVAARNEGDQAPKTPSMARGRGGMPAKGVAVAAMACLVVFPATCHNYRASGEFIPMTAHGGVTFNLGNTDAASGVYTAIPGVGTYRRTQNVDAARVFRSSAGREGSYREIDRFFYAKGLAYLAQDPVRAIKLIGRKFYWFVSGREYSDITYATLEREDGWVHLSVLTPIPTAWLMGLAALGVAVGLRRRSFGALDVALLVLPLLVVAVFWYSPRYRLPAIPMLCLSAAVAIVGAWRSVARAAAPTRLGWATVFLLVVSMMTGPANRAVGFDALDHARPRYEEYKGGVFVRHGRFDIALVHFQESDRLRPGRPSVLASIAGALTELGRLDEAEQVCDRLLAIDEHSPAGLTLLGTIHLRRGDPSGALPFFERVLQRDNVDARAHLGAYFALLYLDRAAAGVDHLRQAVEQEPTYVVAVGQYGVWLAEQGRLAEAEPFLRRAVRLAPDLPAAHFNLGALLADIGRTKEAMSHFEETLMLDPAHARARERLEQPGTPRSTTPR